MSALAKENLTGKITAEENILSKNWTKKISTRKSIRYVVKRNECRMRSVK